MLDQGRHRGEINLNVRAQSPPSWASMRQPHTLQTSRPRPGEPRDARQPHSIFLQNSRQRCTLVLALIAEAALDWGPGLASNNAHGTLAEPSPPCS